MIQKGPKKAKEGTKTSFELYSATHFDQSMRPGALWSLNKSKELSRARQITLSYLLEMSALSSDGREKFAYLAVYQILRFVEIYRRWFFKEESIDKWINGKKQKLRPKNVDKGQDIPIRHFEAARVAFDRYQTGITEDDSCKSWEEE